MPKKLRWAAVALLICLGLPALSHFAGGQAALPGAPAAEATLAVQAGSVYCFTAQTLEKQLEMPAGSLTGLTVTELPPASQGQLMLDGVGLPLYSQLDRSDIDRLCFVPAQAGDYARIGILPQGASGLSVLCMATVEDYNHPPVLHSQSAGAFAGMAAQGAADCYDPDGDPVRLVVVQPPEKGTLTLDGGCYTYTPSPDARGEDQAVLRAMDPLGGCSQDAVFTFSVEKAGQELFFTDCAASPFQYDIAKACQAGLMDGEALGQLQLFRPQQPVDAGEMVVLTVSALGQQQMLLPCINTGLASDSQLSLWQKPYVHHARTLGLISPDFAPGQSLTRAQAVSMVAQAAGMPPVESYPLRLTDLDQIPPGALGDYMKLAAYDMLPAPDGAAHPQDPLDRAYAAALAWRLARYCSTG